MARRGIEEAVEVEFTKQERKQSTNTVASTRSEGGGGCRGPGVGVPGA